MQAVLQLTEKAEVTVEGKSTGSIGQGLLVLLGVSREDSEEDVDILVNKIIHLRIFPDENDKMNLSVLDIKGELLVVSQFTLLANCRKGRRPSYNNAAPPATATRLYQMFTQKAEAHLPVATGKFQAMMKVSLINNGPVTILLDSKELGAKAAK